MAVFETLFLLAGSVAAIAVIGLVAYRGFSGKNTTAPVQHATSMTSSITTVQAAEGVDDPVPIASPIIATPVATPAEQLTASRPLNGISIPVFAAPTIAEPIPEASIPTFAASTIADPIPEAPAPFAEDFTAKTSVPTDVSAIDNFASPTDATVAPVLVIQAPKLKRTRSSTKRRLPTSTSSPGTPASSSNSSTPTGTTTTPRRRRSSRAKTEASPVESSQALAPSPRITEQ